MLASVELAIVSLALEVVLESKSAGTVTFIVSL